MTEHSIEQNKNLHDFSKEDLIEMVKKERHKNAQLFNKRAKLGLSFETPNNRKDRGKEQWDESIAHHVRDHVPYLKNLDDKTVITDKANATHTLIKGDNFPALLALLPEYRGGIDVIYIDPPYNTGNSDFIYNDKYVDKEDGFRHSMWLSFMARRLLLAQELLSKDGVIFVSIDDNEQHHLRMLMDEVFGGKNFIANIIYDGGLKNNSRFVSVGHDYMMFYAKDKSDLYEKDISWRESKKGISEFLNFADYLKNVDKSQEEKQSMLKKWIRENSDILDKGLKAYSFIDEDGIVFRKGDISAPGRNGSRYEVFHPYTNKSVKQPAGGWRYSKDSMDMLMKENLVSFGIDEKTVPQYKRILSRGENSDKVARSYFWDERSNANKALSEILGESIFDYPKSVPVLKRWINLISDKKAIILDFFAGSGTTGHAVAELNAEDGGTRQCILVTDAGKSGNAENSDMSEVREDAVDIADDVTYERMRRVLTGEDWAKPEKAVALNQNLEMKEVQFLSKQGARKRKTDFELTLELSMLYAENGYSFEDAQLYAQRLHNRWKKFAENEYGDLAVWD